MTMENPEEKISNEEKPTSWPVSIDTGKVVGLPPGVSERDVILFIGSEGKWMAQIPDKNLEEEEKEWLGDLEE